MVATRRRPSFRPLGGPGSGETDDKVWGWVGLVQTFTVAHRAARLDSGGSRLFGLRIPWG